MLALTLASFPTLSSNWSWLESSPIEAFTDSDWVKLKESAREVLNNGNDGDTATWINEDTGYSGSITPLNTIVNNGMTCRKTKFFNSANGMTGSSKFLLCKQEDGKWKVSP